MFSNKVIQYTADMTVKTTGINNTNIHENVSNLTDALNVHQNNPTEQTKESLIKAFTETLIATETIRQMYSIQEDDIQKECLKMIINNKWLK